ncbi:pantetheine-phosphate adenylyltransferase [Hippea maritima]|uniref:Phosphopantetheine adenylyltransferase n=1 Tax=Hippea maritima (strain ATCC 700847 / DSM 10411 / MH2) TaxID=760142 RepID=F2LW58_HIPMA|nr:pantetheine-phosphate adenylyltransferase [Hippea maritima]AEA33992.1 Phosphopantetheine adenylyltransferase [Hippea maritima DSM 10411]
MSEVIALVPGTFDPITNGHIDIVKRAKKIFDKIIVAVAVNAGKNPFFNFDERVELTKRVVELDEELHGVEVAGVKGLLVDFAKKENAKVVVRGLRAVSDFEYELQMAFMNRRLNKEVEMVYMMPYIKYSFLSSSIVKDVFFNGGDISKFVPEIVIKAMKKKLSERRG